MKPRNRQTEAPVGVQLPTRELPPGWRMVKLGDVVRQVSEAVRNPAEAGLDRVVGLEHIDTDDLHITRWDDVGDGTSFSKRFRNGQVLFGRRRAYLRKVAYAEFDGICSGDITVMEPNGDGLLPELLPFLVQTDGFYEHTQKVSAGGLSPRARWRDLATYEFPLPPIPEQRRIAEILWAAENVLRHEDTLSSASDRLLEALTRAAMAAGVGEDGKLRTTGIKPAIPPTRWSAQRLGDVARIRRGASPRPIGDPKWFSATGPGWIRISDVTASGSVLLRTEQSLSPAGVARSIRVAPGQVIMSICATIGIPIIVGTEACIHDGFVVFDQHGGRLDERFLVYFLRSQRPYFYSKRQPGTQANINSDIVKECPITLPPVEEQVRIVEFLSRVENLRHQRMTTMALVRDIQKIVMRESLSGGSNSNV